MFFRHFLFLLFSVALCVAVGDETFTQPFYRVLQLTSPVMNGTDVLIAQVLLNRSPYVKQPVVEDGNFESSTKSAVFAFQAGNSLNATGVLDATTGTLLLSLQYRDNYRDSGTIPPGYLYKVHIPVYANRCIETNATLYNAQMQVLRVFRVRTHGQNDPQTGLPLNEFAGYGYTPTGLSEFDLNSPEDDPIDYGPYPVNRFVQGLQGNAALLISDIRDGILLHTGEWANWTVPMPMPNSEGCVHAWPQDVQGIWYQLVALGVQVRPNTFGKLPYPYKPQGVVSVEQLD